MSHPPLESFALNLSVDRWFRVTFNGLAHRIPKVLVFQPSPEPPGAYIPVEEGDAMRGSVCTAARLAFPNHGYAAAWHSGICENTRTLSPTMKGAHTASCFDTWSIIGTVRAT